MAGLYLRRIVLALGTCCVLLTGCGSHGASGSGSTSSAPTTSRSGRSMDLNEIRAASVESNCSVVNGAVR